MKNKKECFRCKELKDCSCFHKINALNSFLYYCKKNACMSAIL